MADYFEIVLGLKMGWPKKDIRFFKTFGEKTKLDQIGWCNQTWQRKIADEWRFLARNITNKWSIFQHAMFDYRRVSSFSLIFPHAHFDFAHGLPKPRRALTVTPRCYELETGDKHLTRSTSEATTCKWVYLERGLPAIGTIPIFLSNVDKENEEDEPLGFGVDDFKTFSDKPKEHAWWHLNAGCGTGWLWNMMTHLWILGELSSQQRPDDCRFNRVYTALYQ